MNIAYINADPGIPFFGNKGCSVHVRSVVNAFADKSAIISVITNRANGTQANPGIYVVEYGKHISRVDELLFSRETNHQILNNLQGKSFDIIYERYSLWSYAALEFAEANNIPSILEINAPLINEQLRYRTLMNTNRAEEILLNNLQKAQLIVCVSEEVKNYVMSKLSTDQLQKVVCVPNGADIKMYSGTGAQNHDGINIGFLGSLKAWHGVDKLLHAFAGLQSKHALTLHIIGEGPMQLELQAICQDLGLQNVQFHGFVPVEQLPRYLRQWDIAVAPYPNLENFYFSPLKLFDYMAAGLSIVASNIGQIPTVLQHNKEGILVTPGNIAELRNALDRLCRDPHLRKTLAYQAHNKAKINYSWDRVTDRILEHLQRICYGRAKVN